MQTMDHSFLSFDARRQRASEIVVACRLLTSGVLLTGFLACLSAFATSDDGTPTRLVLGGPRKVVADIAESSDNLDVTVEMLAVRCFDEATNKLLSREKAKQYAVEALGRHLFHKAGNRLTFTVKGALIERAELDGKRFVLTLRVPRSGVTLAAPTPDSESTEAAPQAKTKATRFARSSLFEVKGDYAETVRQLSAALKAAAPPAPKATEEGKAEAFFAAIADFEERADGDFDAVLAEMRRDKRLLSVEREELERQLEDARLELIAALKKAVEESAAAPPSTEEKPAR